MENDIERMFMLMNKKIYILILHSTGRLLLIPAILNNCEIIDYDISQWKNNNPDFIKILSQSSFKPDIIIGLLPSTGWDLYKNQNLEVVSWKEAKNNGLDKFIKQSNQRIAAEWMTLTILSIIQMYSPQNWVLHSSSSIGNSFIKKFWDDNLNITNRFTFSENFDTKSKDTIISFIRQLL